MKKNLREIVEYVIVGGLTTLVNYVIYFGLDYLWHNWLLANCLAWLGAVIFAYFANKYFVFKTEGKNMEELGKFFGLRFVTLFIENGLLFLMIDILVVNKGISKILVSFITVIGNYYLCKFKVFKKEVVNENN